VLADLARAVGSLDVGWLVVGDRSEVAGQTIAAANLRARTGASIVAIGRSHDVVSNPGPGEVLRPGDRVAAIGSAAEIAQAGRLLANTAAEAGKSGGGNDDVSL
jgi:CPA2 family monovalent cation:H+ antiporter-2